MITENAIKRVTDVFEIMGGTTAMARVLAVGVSTASEIKRRGRIPAEYWRDIIRAAAERGHPEITADLLARLHARDGEPAGLAEEGGAFEAEADAAARPGPANGGAGQFTRFRHLRRHRFRTLAEVNDHIDALRDEWSRR
jgi:hypothetical protein